MNTKLLPTCEELLDEVGHDAVISALARYPDCTYGDWYNGMDCVFNVTKVVKLWRNEECYLAGDPPRHVVEQSAASAS